MRNRLKRSVLDLAILHALFADGDAPAGGAAPVVVAPAAAPAIAAPVEVPKPDAAIISAPAPGAISAEDQRKYLADKGGKADELAKLSEADLKTQFDAAKAKEAAPAVIKAEDIKVTLPEGVTLDEKTMGEFKSVVADANLTPTERAQKLVDLHVGALKAAAEGPYKLWGDTQSKWQGEVKADKEIGGTNFDTMRSTIAKTITDVMGKDAKDVFDAFAFTGAANNPAIVRLMYRMGKAFTEGGSVAGGALAEGKGTDFKSRVAAMYPSATGSQAQAG